MEIRLGTSQFTKSRKFCVDVIVNGIFLGDIAIFKTLKEANDRIDEILREEVKLVDDRSGAK